MVVGPYLVTQRRYPSRLRLLPQLQLQLKLLHLGLVQLPLLLVPLLHLMQALHPLLLEVGVATPPPETSVAAPGRPRLPVKRWRCGVLSDGGHVRISWRHAPW